MAGCCFASKFLQRGSQKLQKSSCHLILEIVSECFWVVPSWLGTCWNLLGRGLEDSAVLEADFDSWLMEYWTFETSRGPCNHLNASYVVLCGLTVNVLKGLPSHVKLRQVNPAHTTSGLQSMFALHLLLWLRNCLVDYFNHHCMYNQFPFQAQWCARSWVLSRVFARYICGCLFKILTIVTTYSHNPFQKKNRNPDFPWIFLFPAGFFKGHQALPRASPGIPRVPGPQPSRKLPSVGLGGEQSPGLQNSTFCGVPHKKQTERVYIYIIGMYVYIYICIYI